MNGRLACGRDLARLVEQVFEGTPPADPEHQARCPHCQAALRRLGSTRAGLGQVRAARVVAPAGLVGDVLARLRSPGTGITVDAGERGSTRSTVEVLSAVAQHAAYGIDAVAYASVVVTDALETGVIALRVRLVIDFGPSAPAVADAVRAAVRDEVQHLTGAVVSAVDVVVDDVAR